MSRLRILELEGSFRSYGALYGLKALREIQFVDEGPPVAELRALAKALPRAALGGP